MIAISGLLFSRHKGAVMAGVSKPEHKPGLVNVG